MCTLSSLPAVPPPTPPLRQVPVWKQCANYVLDILALLAAHPTITLDDTTDALEERTEAPPEDAPVRGDARMRPAWLVWRCA